jgi:hypothetical protein
MKTTQKLICLLAVLCSTVTFAQENREVSKEEKLWMDYMTPGKAHKELAMSDGMWTEDMLMWMAPNTEPMKSTATVMNKMIMGGRYQQGTHRGTFMGMPFEGMSLVGYDNAKQTYVSTWVDNMGTGMMLMEGTWNEDLKGIEFKGMGVDPEVGKDVPMRQIYVIRDADTHVMEMFKPGKDGNEFKCMEITMKRKKMQQPDAVKEAPIKPAPPKTAPPKQPAPKK